MSRRRVAGLVLVALLVLGGALRLALPALAHDALLAALEGASGREVVLEDLSFSLLRGAVEARGLSLSGAVRPALEVRELALDLSWLGLFARRVEIEGLRVAGVRVALARGESLLVPEAATRQEAPGAAEAPTPEPADGAWPLRVDRVELAELELALGDAAAPTRLTLAGGTLAHAHQTADGLELGALTVEGLRVRLPVDLERAAESGESIRIGGLVDALPRIHVEALRVRDAALVFEAAEGAGETQLGLDFALDDVLLQRGGTTRLVLDGRIGEGTLHLEGELALDPLGFEGVLGFTAVDLASVQPLVAGVQLEGGSTTADLELGFRVVEAADGEGFEARLGGDLALSEVQVQDPDRQLLGWDELRLAIRDVRWEQPAAGPPQLSVAFERIRVKGPALRWSRPAPASAPAGEPRAESSLRTALEADRIEVQKGRIFAGDPGIEPPLELQLGFEGSAQGVRWPQRDVALLGFSITGDEDDAIAVSGSLEAGRGRLEFEVDSVDLQRFDGYASALALVGIEAGRLSWQGGIDLDPERAQLDGEVVLADLELVEREEGVLEGLLGINAMDLSYDTALAMLRDAEGRIALPVDVAVDRGGTRVDLVAVLRRALQGAVQGALARPLAAVRLVAAGGLGEEVALPAIAFTPGSARASEAADERLAGLAEALALRNDVVLVLVGRAGPVDARHLERGDSTPEQLARARARVCADRLVARFGVEPDRIELGPAGEGAPSVALRLKPRAR